MNSILKFGILSVLCCFASSCSSPEKSDIEKGRQLYFQDKLNDALPLLRQATTDTKAGSDDFAYLAETYRRLGDRDKALESAEKALQIDPCNTFAHITLSYIYNPMYGNWPGADRQKAWDHIQKGIECDSGDGNVWLAAWTEAIFRENKEMESESLRMMIQTGILTPAILAYNRWMLRYLPENAIILTSGDMDTYPAVALQETEDFRPDVIVMNYSLLNTRWYQRHLQERYAVKFPLSDDELDNLRPYGDNGRITTVASQIMNKVCQAASKGEFDFPVAMSITLLDTSFIGGLEDHIVLKGAYKLLATEPEESNYDIEAIRTSLESLNIQDFAGPFASQMDRSPVRRTYTATIASNFPNLAILVIEKYNATDRTGEALDMLDWADQMEKLVIKDPEIEARLVEIRKTISEKSG